MCDNNLIIYAPTVSSFGGKALLQGIIDSVAKTDALFILSENISLSRMPENYSLTAPGIKGMIKAEQQLKRVSNRKSTIISFANRPPLFKLTGYVATVLLSAYAIELPKDAPVSLSRNLKSRIQRLFNILIKNNTDCFVARAPETVELIKQATKKETHYFPFMTESLVIKRSLREHSSELKSAIYFYPADDQPHKNHKVLFGAWKLLSDEKIDARLVVTLSDEKAKKILNNYKQFGIEATGFVEDSVIEEFYKTSDALVFPSLLESFSLPLIEARKHDLDIIASERNYIREQVDPEETFDPSSELSLAMAIKRYMGLMNKTEIRPNGGEFVDFVFNLAHERRQQSQAVV